MNFSEFAIYLEKLEKTASRLEMTRILAELFKNCSPEEIDKVCYLALGQLAPKYEGIEFNMAEKLVIRALAIVANQKPDEIMKAYKKIGDLGGVALEIKTPHFAEASRGKQKSKLSIIQIYDKLLGIANENGAGSVERKINKLVKLLTEVDSLSAKFIVRIPINKLRLGFSDMTVLDALSWMEKGNKSLRKDLENAFNVLADIGKIAKILKFKGLRGIKSLKSQAGVPIRPAKAERLSTPELILEKMEGQCVLEPKYDGFRVQIHIDKLKTQNSKLKATTQNLNLFENKKNQCFVRIFSRNLEDTTPMFPDIVEAAQKLNVKNAIFDGEAIAFNPQTKKFLPFQETVQRKRKHGISEKAKEIPLKVFLFDLLYLDDQLLLEKPFIERRQLLEQVLKQNQFNGLKVQEFKKGIVLTQQKKVTEAKEFNKFFKEVVNEGLEGLMAKKLDSTYQAGARNFNWVKYKAGMTKEMADTVDCVVMGYYRGLGKRTTFGLGAFLVGVVNDKGEIVTISKIGTGLTDEQWREMHQRCEKLKVSEKPAEYLVHKNLNPDVWCRPELIVEIEADMITKSPIHTAGLALRFPRLKRFRDDKNLGEATTLKELKSFS